MKHTAYQRESTRLAAPFSKRARAIDARFLKGAANDRPGFTLLELTVAAGLLGVLFLVTIPLLARVRDTREETQRRFLAQQEAANVMERLSLRAALGTIEDALARDVPVSPEAAAMLPQAKVSVSRTEQADEAGNLRVTVAVSWLSETGEHASPVSLDAWFPAPEVQP